LHIILDVLFIVEAIWIYLFQRSNCALVLIFFAQYKLINFFWVLFKILLSIAICDYYYRNWELIFALYSINLLSSFNTSVEKSSLILFDAFWRTLLRLLKIEVRKSYLDWLANWLRRKLLDDEFRKINSLEISSFDNNNKLKVLEKFDIL